MPEADTTASTRNITNTPVGIPIIIEPPSVSIEVVTLPPAPEAKPQVTIEVATLTPTPQTVKANAFGYLHGLVNKSEALHLLDSYETVGTFNDNDTAWTYDNALALLAFLARRETEDLAAARMLADALVYAQNHDPEFTDGRLRDSYHANSFIRNDGTVHVDRGGSATGNMAWATLALLQAWQTFGDESHFMAAERLGQWIVNSTHDERGAGGYVGGIQADGTKFEWKATEHNADIYPAFMQLYEATGDLIWRQHAMSAKRFLQTMWDAEQGLFWTGTTLDGQTVNPHPIPEDTQSWTLLALGEADVYGRGLVWAEENLSGEGCEASETAVGYRFSNAGSGYWPEGTAHMALAWQAVGDHKRSEQLLASLRSIQTPLADSSALAIPAACGTEAVTGYGWSYPLDVPHIGATAWYLMVEEGYNPFWGIPTSDQIPYEGIYDVEAASQQFQNGMNYAAWWQGDFQSPEAAASLAAMAETNRNWVSIVVTCYQETYVDTDISCDLQRTLTDEDVVVAIQQAHDLGLQVMLKPHLDLNSDDAHWRGDIGSGFATEAEWSAWFAAYQDFIIHYAALAEQEGVAQFVVGTELVGTSQREADWREIVTAVRDQFSGKLVYASNQGGEETAVTWWDSLDYIGVDAYYTLATTTEPTVTELESAWAEPLTTLATLSLQYNKPIIITEIGYRSTDGTAMAPWNFQASSELDLQEQADAYEATLNALCPQPWLAGIYWWYWSPRPEGGENNRDYTPRGKPAEDILRRQPCGTLDLQATSDKAFLDEVAYRAFRYFWQEANPETGLIKDRANNFDSDDYDVASIAAVGFGLSGLCVGKERGWVEETAVYNRALTTLQFFRDEMTHEHGFYYHFVDMKTGERVWESEVSSIDTALFLAGALTIGRCFPDTELEVIANELYERTDFQWLLTDGGARPNELLLGHGWKPESGFLPYRWDSYSELMILYLLAIGSPTHSIPVESWAAWARPEGRYGDYTTFAIGPLFVHQYSHAWVDFRNRQDGLGYDYFQSSVNATLVNRQFAIDNRDNFITYEEHIWGLTASDGPTGYRAYGAPPGTAVHDGTVAPAAAAGSIVFTPVLSTQALRAMYAQYGEKIWGRYGFSDAFNVDQDWWDQDVIGIDLGISLLMLENARSGLTWQTFMSHSAIEQALAHVGFSEAEP